MVIVDNVIGHAPSYLWAIQFKRSSGQTDKSNAFDYATSGIHKCMWRHINWSNAARQNIACQGPTEPRVSCSATRVVFSHV